MHTAELIKNEVLSEAEIVQLRDVFVKSYCDERAWDVTNLSYEQIFEIRSNKAWKNPGILKS